MKCSYKVALVGRCNKSSGVFRYCWQHRCKKYKIKGEQAIGDCTYVGADLMCCKPTVRKDFLCEYHHKETTKLEKVRAQKRERGEWEPKGNLSGTVGSLKWMGDS